MTACHLNNSKNFLTFLPPHYVFFSRYIAVATEDDLKQEKLHSINNSEKQVGILIGVFSDFSCITQNFYFTF